MAQSYQVFARKYRPRTFEDVLGQDHVVQTLRNAIEQERLAHAYLFVGPRGTGKTSTARILSKALNCPGGPKADFDPDDPICIEIAEGRNLDVLEIDGASNNGVDQVRDLRDTVKFAPACGKFKIYYIDEVHMLSTAAFNALLKTLEEPPPHVKFIFATTEPNKILPTIISRCQRFDLRRIPDNIIEKHLLYIAEEEKIQLDTLAAHAIAKGAEGGMRDAQSMLDQLVAFCGDSIAEADVLQIFGFTSFETIAALAGNLLNHNTPGALEVVYQQSEGGKDLIRLMGDLISHLRNLLIAQADASAVARELPPAVAETVKLQAAAVSTERLLKLIDHFAEADSRMKWAPNKQLHFEIGVIKAVQTLQETTLSDVIRILAGATEGVSLNFPSAMLSASVSTLATAPVPTAGIAEMAAASSIEPAQEREPDPAPKANAVESKPAEPKKPTSESKPATVTTEPAAEVPAAPDATTPPPPPSPSSVPSAQPVPEPAHVEKPAVPTTPAADVPQAASKGLFSDLRDSMKQSAAEPKPKAERKNKAAKAEPTVPTVPTIAPVADAADGAALWQRTVEVLAEQKPLQVAWAREGAFLSLSGDSLVIGFDKENADHREQLERSSVRKSIEAILSGAAGRPMSIHYEVHDTITAPKPVLAEIPEEQDSGGTDSKGAAEDAAPTEIDESFYDDPAIKSALKIFNAKIKGRA
jgi:DNA polymerase III subunit gamma/tau